MHRNAILSRITDTTANELGWEFYLRLVTFGAVPVLTWLAYQFPEIGGTLYKVASRQAGYDNPSSLAPPASGSSYACAQPVKHFLR
jgi:hypothetical protein